MPGSAKQPTKPAGNAGSKNGDLNRKQTSSPSNGAQRYDISSLGAYKVLFDFTRAYEMQ